jgi:hypothetical protein
MCRPLVRRSPAPRTLPTAGSPVTGTVCRSTNWASAATATGSSSAWPTTSTGLPELREAVATGELGWTKAQQVARVAGETTQAAWVAKAKVTGRRELEREVHAARQRRRRGGIAGAGQLELGAAVAPAQLLADGQVAALDTTPAEDPPATITLRADGLQLARFEALVESARKRGLVPRTADPHGPGACCARGTRRGSGRSRSEARHERPRRQDRHPPVPRLRARRGRDPRAVSADLRRRKSRPPGATRG